MKSKFRQNKLTGEWVIFAPSRRRRPMDFVREVCEIDLPGHDPDCPFCPGNENMLSRIIHETKGKGNESWAARAVYNKYPALTTEGEDCRSSNGIYLESNGFGLHMVILESPRHDIQMYNMTREEMLTVVEMYHYCYSLVSKDSRVMLIKLFKNYGRTAGASLNHPHSQLVASCIVPKYIREKESEEQRYFDENGRCVMCDVLKFELDDGQRLIFENQRFAVFVPFAAEVPFETWIVPKRHSADFNDIDQGEHLDLAESLQRVMTVFKDRLGSPEYNFTVNSCTRYKSREPHLHWFLRIVPRLTTRAGFEIGTGMCINPSLPEADAQFLRSTADISE